VGHYIQKQYEYDTTRDGPVMHISWDNGYGEVVVQTWVQINEIRDRQTCFCCSCGDREGSDIACRNHGFAASRPCEKHGTEGTAWGEEMCDCLIGGETPESHDANCAMGKMPKSVEEYLSGR
jgi:hypothetical protein